MKPLAIRTYHQRRRRRARFLGIGLVIVVFGGLIYLLVRPSTAKPKARVSTAPVSPPTPIAVVTQIGSGAALGTAARATIIDLANLANIGQHHVEVGAFPDAVAIDASRDLAYVTNYAASTVTPINLMNGVTGKAIPAGSGPAGIAITPNGKMAYVTDAGSAPMGNTGTPINLVTDRPLRAIRVGLGPQGIAITPDGSRAYVANAGAIVTGQSGAIGHTVTPINLQSGRTLTPINVGNAPIAVAISQDGTTAFVTNSYSGSVSPISIATGTAGTPIQMSGSPQAVTSVPSKGEMIVANAATTGVDNLTLISVATDSATSSFPVPKNPTAVVATADGKSAWVVCFGASTLVRVDISTGVVDTKDAITIPNGPYALALSSIPSANATSLFSPAPVKKSKSKSKG